MKLNGSIDKPYDEYGGYVTLQTIVPWSDSSASPVIQRAYFKNSIKTRYSISESGAWSAWTDL